MSSVRLAVTPVQAPGFHKVPTSVVSVRNNYILISIGEYGTLQSCVHHQYNNISAPDWQKELRPWNDDDWG